MIVESNVENYFVDSEIEVSEINSNLQQDTVYSEELEWNELLQLRITEDSQYRITEDNNYRELG